MTKITWIFSVLLCFVLLEVPLSWSQQWPEVLPHQEDLIDVEHHRGRRLKFRSEMEGGIAVIMASKKDQDFIYEFFVPHSDLHDFIYLTGLDGANAWGSVLVMAPGAETYQEILYTSMDPETMRNRTGIEHVYPKELFLEHLSDAMSDYSLLRTWQRGSKPLASDISRALGTEKIIYFNFQRFLNLSTTPPERLDVANRIRYFSPEIQMKDASDILNRLRMIHDEKDIELLRKASDITVKAYMESARAIRAGMTTQQIGAIVNFIFAYEHAAPSFRTNVRITGPPKPRGEREWPIGLTPRLGAWPVKDGDMISYDIGAEFKHYTSDFGRTIPVSGKYTPEQRRIAEIVTRIQKATIAAVKPGGTFRESQELKDRLMEEAGLGDRTVLFGISHFVGMEIHDVGNYDIPWEPGMCFVIEWSVQADEFAVRFEDVIVVTQDGHEWLTSHAPIEPDEIEKLIAEKGIWE